MAQVTQPVIRDAFVHYLRTVATTLRPKTVESRAASLTLFGSGSPGTIPASPP
jgi:hypothetical protein